MFVSSREKAHRLYTACSRQFVERFLSARHGALRIRSRAPAAAWNTDAGVGYLTVSPWQPYWTPPDSELGIPPLLLSVHVNLRPPPGLFYSMRSRLFRDKLGVRADTPLLTVPQFELYADPEEVVSFAEWVVEWERGQSARSLKAPVAPAVLDGAEAGYDFFGDDGRWLAYEYLWTVSAAHQQAAWFTR
jgi:hypothetical protein